MRMIQQLRERFISKVNREQEVYDELRSSMIENGDLMSASHLLRWAAQKFTTEIALIGEERVLSYQELFFRASLLSRKLINVSIVPSDRIILYFENSVEFYIAYFAIWQAGAVCVPLNIFLHERELALILEDSAASAVIASSCLAPQFKSILKSEVCKKNIHLFTEQDIDWDSPLPSGKKSIFDEYSCAQFEIDAMCLLLYTSGTTGVPKGVMLSSRNVMTNLLQSLTRFSMYSNIRDSRNRERFFAALPLFHVFAQNVCVWLPMLIGASVIIVPRIDRAAILKGLMKKPSLFFGVPALFGMLCLLKTAPLESIKFFVCGGDVLPDKIRSAFAMVYGRKICSGYGLTEASPVVAFYLDNEENEPNVVGTPLIGIACDIRDECGESLGPNIKGELWIRGDNIMLGYYKAIEVTNKVLRDGWLSTGDLAMIDSHGHLALVGRSKDLIIHKGFNIYPQEIENVLLKHPAVFKAAVIGKDDAIAGQIPVAFIALRDDDKKIEEKLREFCREHLAAYKIPRKFVFLDDLPMNQIGKINKKELKVD